jgi:UDP-N-acetylglucosamine--N-acetylmuramyl-(pentapeptide) pyrophosphoryl-undecaprenol N-acetylglucosamine transferase
MAAGHDLLSSRTDVQLIWQMGKLYAGTFGECDTARLAGVCALEFIDRMDLAYAAADLVLCRSGALTIAELAVLGKPAVLVPSPHVTADHQTKNAMALVDHGAARLVADADAVAQLLPTALDLLDDAKALADLQKGLEAFAQPDAAHRIASIMVELAEKRTA